MIIIYGSILILLLLDQLVKYLVVVNLPLYSSISIINDIFSLVYIRNEGAAWGILSGNMIFFYIVTIVIVLGMMYFAHTKKLRTIEKIIYILIMAGALGNFIDRIRLEYVIDMFKLDFINFPIFNVADIYLTTGISIVLLDTILSELKGKKKRNEHV